MKSVVEAGGADAIKLQTYTADTLSIDCDNALFFQIKQRYFSGMEPLLYKLYQNAFTPWKWQPELKRMCGRGRSDLFLISI